MRMGSSNPVFRSVRDNAYASDTAVTYTSVAVKTFVLILITGGIGAYTYLTSGINLNIGYLIGALIIGFISVIIGTRSVSLSPVFSVIYAAAEGYVLGSVSAIYGYLYEGIIPTAISTTLVVVLITMLMYSTGMVKVTSGFKSFIVIGLVSVIIMSLVSLFVPFSGSLYFVIVIFSAVLSVLFLFYDFDNINRCVESGTDSSYSWILALGLMVTIVWVYMEILRLLAILARRR